MTMTLITAPVTTLGEAVWEQDYEESREKWNEAE